MTINAKITLLSTLIFGLLLAIFATLIYRDLQEVEITKIDARLEVQGEKVEAEFEEEQGKDPLRVMNIFLSENAGGMQGVRMQLYDREGKIIFPDSTLAGSPHDPLRAAVNGSQQKGSAQLADKNYRYLWTPISAEESVEYVLQLAMPMEEVEARLESLRLLFFVTIPATLIVTAIAAFFITRIAFRPMRKMVETANRISATNLSTRLELPAAQDEVHLLGETLNKMMERIDAAFKAQKKFIADASHEMRTPLTVVSNELEFMEKRTTDATLRESIQTSLSEIDRLATMAEGMLLLARLDASQEILRKKNTRLDELVVESVQVMRSLAVKRNVEIVVTIEDAVEIMADTEKLKSAILNLLDNAIKYSKPYSGVAVRISFTHAEPKTVIVAVEDKGSGIPVSDIPNIFNRFYRADLARANAAGSGLGLAIVDRVAALHGGTISVHSEEGKGSVFSLELPLS